MGWMRMAVAAVAAASLCLISIGPVQAQAAGPQCKAACNTAHAACTRRAINSDTCLRRWLACKKKCSGRPASPPPVAPSPPKAAPAKK